MAKGKGAHARARSSSVAKRIAAEETKTCAGGRRIVCEQILLLWEEVNRS